MNTYSVAAQLKAMGADKFIRDFKNATKSVQTFVSDNEKAFESMRKVGKVAMAGGLAIGAGLGFAVKTAATFEAAMSEVGAISGATGKDMKLLEETAREWGSTTSFSATEAAEGLKYMALAGWDTQQMMGGIGPILHLAEAGAIDLGRASDLVTDSMSALGIEVKDLDGYLDMVAQTSRKSNTDIDALMEAFVVAGGTFSRFNIPLEEANAFLGVLANRGTKGSEAGTALNAIMTRLGQSTGPAADALKEMGVSAYDSEGNFRGMEVVMKDIEKAMSKMTDKEKAHYTQQLAGLNHGKSFTKMLQGLGDEYDDLKGDVENSKGALQEMRDEMKDNLQGALENLWSAIEDIAISIGDALLPYVKMATQFLQKLADGFIGLSDPMKKAIAIIAAISSVVLTVGGAFLILVGMLPMIVAGFSHVAAIFGLVKAAILAFSGPIAIVIGVIAGLVAAGIYLYKNWETVKGKMASVFQSFKPLFDRLKESVSNLKSSMQPAIESLKSAWEGLKPILILVAQVVGGVLAVSLGLTISIINGVINAVGPLIQTFAALVDFVANMVSAIVALFQGDFAGAWDYVKVAASAAVDVFMGLINTVVGFISGFVESIIDFFYGLYMTLVGNSIIPDMVEEIVEWFANMLGWLVDIVMNIVDGVVDGFKAVYEAVSDYIEMAMDIVVSVWDFINDTFKNALDFIVGLVTGDFGKMKDAIKSQMENSEKLIDNIWSAIDSFLSKILGSIWDSVKSAFTKVYDTMKNATNKARDAVSNGFNTAKNIVSNVTNGIRSAVTNGFNAARNVVTNVANGIRSAVSNGFNASRNVVSSVTSSIRSTVSNIFNSLRGIVSGAMSGVRNAVSNGIRGALNVITGMVSNFFNAGKNIVTSIANGIKSAVGKVGSAIGNVASKIRNFLPFSPAKEGPLRDIMNVRISESIASAIDSGSGVAIKAMQSLTSGLDKEAASVGDSLAFDTSGIDISRRVNSINKQAERQLTHSFDSHLNVTAKQPAYINVSIGNRDFEGFVDDISEVQDRNTMLKKSFA